MSEIRKLAGDTVLYGLGTILPRFLNFLLVPIHTVGMFSRAEYGEITRLLSVVAFVNVVYLFGMETAYFRFATIPGEDEKKIYKLTQTVVLLISVLVSVSCIVWANPIAAWSGIAAHPRIIVWISLVMFTDAVVAIPFARLRLQKRALLFAAAKVSNVVLAVALNLWFLKYNYDPAIGIEYVFLCMVISNLVYLPFFLPVLLAWRPRWDGALSPKILNYGYPVMLTGLAGMTNEMFSRLTLDWWLPPDFYPDMTNEAALGVFGACYKFAVFMNLGIQAFRYAAEPFFFTKAADRNSPELFARVNHYFVIVGAAVLLGVTLYLDVLQYFIGEEFRSGLGIVPVLLLAYLFLGIYYNVSIWFKLTDRTSMGTVITIIGAMVTIGMNYWLIPIYGYVGSSYAALGCYGVMLIICYAAGQRYYPVPYRVFEDAGYILFAFMLIAISSQVELTGFVWSFMFHSFLFAVFAVVVYLRERRSITLL